MRLAHREEGGSGPLLLLLHGAARTLEDWQLVAPLLTGHYRVVTCDLRGHGLSPTGAWTFEDVVQDVAELLEHLGEPDAVVAGHSLGGMVAVLCAAQVPVARAVNLDGLGAGVTSPELVELALDQLPGCRAPLPLADFDALLAAVEQGSAAAGVDPAPVLAGLRRASREEDGQVRAVPDEATVRAVLAEVGRLDLGAALAAVRVPTQVVRCTRTPPPPAEVADLYAEHTARLDTVLARADRHPLVQVVEVPETHGLLLESPAAVADLLVGARDEGT